MIGLAIEFPASGGDVERLEIGTPDDTRVPRVRRNAATAIF